METGARISAARPGSFFMDAAVEGLYDPYPGFFTPGSREVLFCHGNER
jgi:hypothetical protein